MKKKCSDCKAIIEFEPNELDNGDEIECPECGKVYIAEADGEKIKLVSEKEKFLKEDEEFDLDEE
jgi:DNA-directed RNA polymerase subunit RPC12/RpoP